MLKSGLYGVQDILEKFEFFPVKCRIQRAMETFQMARDKMTDKMFKLKVTVPRQGIVSSCQAILILPNFTVVINLLGLHGMP